jgi:hypothetical protein
VLARRDLAGQAAPPHEHPRADRPAPQPHQGMLQVCPECPPGRESSGTSWQPDTTDAHLHTRQLGPWQLATHAQVALAYTDERGPRGARGAFVTNHVMFRARRPVGAGVFGVQSMWSLEPVDGRRGYPLLFQTGETADGVSPLIDRQHPHDFPMELAFTYSRSLSRDRGFYLYVAPAGAPALGPPAFMHRASGSRLPLAPITHHFFDSTHVTYGVVTLGFLASPRVKFEGSVFRGREPDQHRWGFERPDLDSYAFRLSVNPTASLAVQVSAGHVEQPEQLHPGSDSIRLTASAMYARRWGPATFDATVAVGRNRRTPAFVPVPNGVLYFAGNVTQGVLGEATVRLARHSVITRVEFARKDDLFGVADPRHFTLYALTRITGGYVFDVVARSRLRVGIGIAGSGGRAPSAIRPDYGGSPRGVLAFVDLSAH